jgi:hypothetical protein
VVRERGLVKMRGGGASECETDPTVVQGRNCGSQIMIRQERHAVRDSNGRVKGKCIQVS